MRDVRAAIKFFKKYVGDYYSYSDLRGWFIWAMNNGLFMMAKRNNDIVGIAIVRPCNKVPYADMETFDPTGRILHVDMCVTENLSVVRSMAQGCLQLFGDRDSIAFHKGERARVHDYKKAMAALLKLPGKGLSITI